MNRRAQPWLGTLVDISAEGSHAAIDTAFAAVARVHRLMSFHDPASDLSRLNRALPGDAVTVDAHTWQVLHLAEQVRSASDGLFNVACAPQLVAWACLPPPDAGHSAHWPSFQPALTLYRCEPAVTVPDAAQDPAPDQARDTAPDQARDTAPDTALDTVPDTALDTAPNTVLDTVQITVQNTDQYQARNTAQNPSARNMIRKLAPGWIDLGGIAKGYAVDLAIEALRDAGVEHACVNAGGDLRVLGGRPWPVAVRDPAQPQRVHTQLALRDEAMATSASYFSQRRHEGASVCALLDGRTGAAMVNGRSVSVRAPLCAVADALTKVVMASDNPHHPALARWNATSFIL